MLKKIFQKIKDFFIRLFGGIPFVEVQSLIQLNEDYHNNTDIVVDKYIKHINVLRYENNEPIYAEYNLCEMCTNKYCCEYCENNRFFTLFNTSYIKSFVKREE